LKGPMISQFILPFMKRCFWLGPNLPDRHWRQKSPFG
jgi:hypothetical protein